MSTELRRLGLLVLATWLTASPARAATPTVEDLRAEARSLLQTVCGWQCDVVDIRIKPKALAPVGAVAPGFDDTPAARSAPGSVDVTLLLDAALAPSLRAFVTERVRTRLGELGLPVTVTERVVAFPPRPSVSPNDPPPAATPPPAPAPPTIVIPPAPAAAPAPLPPPEPKTPALERLVDRLIEALPLLLLGLLLAWTVLRVLSRYEAMLSAPPEPAPEAVPAPAPPPSPPVTRAPPDAHAIEALLIARRGGARRVFSRLLAAGEDEVVAHAVARFGPAFLVDVAADPTHTPALARAARRAAEVLGGETTEEAQHAALRVLEAELVADRVAYPVEPVPAPLEAVLALGPEAHAALVDALSGRARLLLLKHGPAELTRTYVAGRAAGARATLAREIVVTAPATAAELTALGEAIAGLLPSAALAAGESERLAELVDLLPAAEQEALVGALSQARPDLLRHSGGRLPVESALASVPEAALARAFDAVPLATWATYLRAAPDSIRSRALAAVPRRLAEALAEELALRVTADARTVALARRAVIRAALKAAQGLASGSPGPQTPTGGPAR